MKKQSGIVLVVRETGLILAVTNRAHGGWCLPGGKVEKGETPREAAARELMEETGLAVWTRELAWLAKSNSLTESGREVHLFLARVVFGEPHAVEKGTKVAWLTIAQLKQSKPFGDYYDKVLPDGIWHLRPTR